MFDKFTQNEINAIKDVAKILTNDCNGGGSGYNAETYWRYFKEFYPDIIFTKEQQKIIIETLKL